MTTVAGQCLQCGHKNSEEHSRCVRCDAVLSAVSHPHDHPHRPQVLPWIAGAVALIIGLAMLMRPDADVPKSPAPPGAFAASAGEPPPEELVVVGASSGAPAPGAPPPVAGVEGRWREVMQMDGTGDKRTPVFSIIARHWRIRWASYASQDANGWVYAIIYRRSGKSVGMAINGKGESGGVTRLQGRGSYSVEVKATQNWTMSVEQWY